MPQPQKLYQILEKAHIETKIAVEIQDWILETMEGKRKDSMLQFEDTKLLPMHQEMRTKFEMMESRFDSLRSEMNTRFTSLEKRLDATNFSIRLLACSYRWRNYRRCGSRILTDLREVEVGIK